MSVLGRLSASNGAAAVVTVMSVVAVYLLYRIYILERQQRDYGRWEYQVRVNRLRQQVKDSDAEPPEEPTEDEGEAIPVEDTEGN